MKTKQSAALVSTSALAAGIAQGAIIYSGPLNLQQSLGFDDPNVRQPVNMLGGPNPDFTFGYEFGSTANGVLTPVVQKPYVDVRTFVSLGIPVQSGMVSVLGKANQGLPVTPSGTMIDASYASTYPVIGDGRGYMYQDGTTAAVTGDWSGTAVTDAYVGIELNPGDGTHYGWLHFKDDPTATPLMTLTLVDWAYESTPGVGILISEVPEPSTAALAGLGIAGLLLIRKRK